ncbi:hypothetical protein [Zhongshania sp.]|uniref:hypothetical protein n=1 Tax=Zhongshania sp. TaxID=1971902 RepID=UPI0035633E9A
MSAKSIKVYAASKADLVAKVLRALKEWDWSRPVVVTLSDGQKKSDRQRGYQFGWVYKQIVEQLQGAGIDIEHSDGRLEPWNVDLLHEVMKRKILAPLVLEWGGTPFVMVDGEEVPTKALTTEGSMSRFCEYIARVKEFVWTHWEIAVPEPVDEYYQQIERDMRKTTLREAA